MEGTVEFVPLTLLGELSSSDASRYISSSILTILEIPVTAAFLEMRRNLILRWSWSFQLCSIQLLEDVSWPLFTTEFPIDPGERR